jgi:hypothetical protein
MLPDSDRVDAIGSYWGNPKTRTFAELLIDCEGGSDAPGGARRHALGGRLVPVRTKSHAARLVSALRHAVDDTHGLLNERFE